MSHTPKTAKVLHHCLMAHGWTQSDLAKAASVAIPTVSHHINGARPIRDDHLAAYLPCLDRSEQRQLLAAWLHDLLPAKVQHAVLDPVQGTVAEEVQKCTFGLTAEQQSMLSYWAQRLTDDDELGAIFAAITRRAGWRPTA